MSAGTAAPLFILSFRHRDELSGLFEEAGWQPISARRARGAELRFIASGASVAVIDARGALPDGQEAARALGEAVEANAGALLVLLSRTDSDALDGFFRLGATHFLVSPFTEQQLRRAVQFAARHAERVGGGSRHSRRVGDGDEAPGVCWRWRPGTASLELGESLARMLGVPQGDASARQLFRRLGPSGRKAAKSALRRLLASGRPDAFAHPGAGGARIAHHIRLDRDTGEVVGRSERIGPDAAQGERDAMTGFRGAQSARQWLDEQLAATRTEEPALVLLLLAVSRFDAINAAFGRATGDSVLQGVARRIERFLDRDHRKCMMARLAGAEFAIGLAAPTSLAEGRFLAGQMVEAIGRPFLSGDHVITMGSRVGVAASAPGDDAAALLRRASAALAEAKSGEAGPVRVLDSDAQEASFLGDQLEIDLRRALDEDRIEILFQPQVSITSGKVLGAEALARWRHPRFGELGAVTLFNVAERSDYLAELSDHVQRKAVALASEWPEALASLRLSVNITAADMVRPGFAAQFLEMVDASGFERSRLTVEVTESGLIEELGTAAILLAELREGGLRIAIDDFGTGYSSLAYLKALPLDYLKIDKRLSEDIAGSARDRIVVRSVIEMARSLGLTVIAEGVETQEQLDLLAREGCNLYQGFLCAGALPTSELAELVGEAA